jgi:hypothetical protein
VIIQGLTAMFGSRCPTANDHEKGHHARCAWPRPVCSSAVQLVRWRGFGQACLAHSQNFGQRVATIGSESSA